MSWDLMVREILSKPQLFTYHQFLKTYLIQDYMLATMGDTKIGQTPIARKAKQACTQVPNRK